MEPRGVIPRSLTALAHTPENCTLCKNGDIARPDTYDSEYERVTTRRKRGEGKGKKKKSKRKIAEKARDYAA